MEKNENTEKSLIWQQLGQLLDYQYMEFCVPFVKMVYFICLKGPNANLELEESKVAMEVLGIEFV